MIKIATEKIKEKRNLLTTEMEDVFAEIMGGAADTDDIAAFLLALKDKGETVDEITGAALSMRKFSEKIKTKHANIIDTCGTGGDCAGTFNISTLSAIVAAGAGCVVAKHGNNAVSSMCGSADLLEKLGVRIDVKKKVVERCIDEIGIGFLFAPNFHPAMKYAMPARKKIKARTIFNILGPLTNPAGATRQIIGVFNKELVSILISVLKNLGAIRAMVVHGRDGLDEITTSTFTDTAELTNGIIKKFALNPVDYNMKLSGKNELSGGDATLNAKIAKDILEGKIGPKRDAVLLNAGCAVYVSGLAPNIQVGIDRARESLDSRRALHKLDELKDVTNE